MRTFAREHKEKSTTDPPCVVTPAKCRRPRGTLSCADRASGGEAHSHLSCVRMVTVPSLGGGQKGKNSSRFTSEALINEKPVPCRAAPMPRRETRASPNRAVPLLSTVMLLAIIVTTTCLLRTGVARDMRT